jgi:phenylacetate-CoA ligase
MREPEVEARPWAAQRAADEPLWRAQLDHLFAHSRFYLEKLRAAGFDRAERVGGLDRIAELPLTDKDELRASRSPEAPIGAHQAVPLERVVRIFSTSGTTGTPSYIPLTAGDLDAWVTVSARSYAASGVRAGERLVSTYNAGPFVAGAALEAFTRLGLCHIPIGSADSSRLLAVVRDLRPQALALTPSYALHLAEKAAAGQDLAASGVRLLLVAGEPGGGEPAFRERLESAWGAMVCEAMGIGDIGVSLLGECPAQAGMHFSARGFVHLELIDPASGEALPLEDGAQGELVLTHLRQQAAPLVRFRTRDHVRVWTGPCACGRTAPRLRCIGRTDDMLILRGVNLFPSAVRDLIGGFAPAVSGVIAIRPQAPGARQEPPLPVAVELAEGVAAETGLAERIQKRIRETLLVTTEVKLLPFGSLPRSAYKSKLVERG